MVDLIRSWVYALGGAAVVCAVATELTPRGPVKGVVKTVCAAVLAAALLSPLAKLDFPAYALEMAKYREGAARLTGAAGEISDRLNRRVIEEELAAYILDKAAALGAVVRAARVTLEWSGEGCWYPVAAELEGPCHPGLAAAIEAELGIPEAAQTWRDDEEP